MCSSWRGELIIIYWEIEGLPFDSHHLLVSEENLERENAIKLWLENKTLPQMPDINKTIGIVLKN